MELKLLPVMTRLDPERDIARAIRFTPMYDGKFSPVVRLFFHIGLWAYEAGIVPHDPMCLQALLQKESAAESKERLPAEERQSGPGLARKQSDAGSRRPRAVSANRIDPFHIVLHATFTAFQRRPELERV